MKINIFGKNDRHDEAIDGYNKLVDAAKGQRITFESLAKVALYNSARAKRERDIQMARADALRENGQGEVANQYADAAGTFDANIKIYENVTVMAQKLAVGKVTDGELARFKIEMARSLKEIEAAAITSNLTREEVDRIQKTLTEYEENISKFGIGGDTYIDTTIKDIFEKMRENVQVKPLVPEIGLGIDGMTPVKLNLNKDVHTPEYIAWGEKFAEGKK